MSVVLNRRRRPPAHLQRRRRRDFCGLHRYADKDETGALDPSHLDDAKEMTAKLNADGFRVVAVAVKECRRIRRRIPTPTRRG